MSTAVMYTITHEHSGCWCVRRYGDTLRYEDSLEQAEAYLKVTVENAKDEHRYNHKGERL